jgi:hypothetical protein
MDTTLLDFHLSEYPFDKSPGLCLSPTTDSGFGGAIEKVRSGGVVQGYGIPATGGGGGSHFANSSETK